MDEALVDLARRLDADGVTTPVGEPYSIGALNKLRETAMAWQGRWLDEAAFRTHQEAGSPATVAGRALVDLCRVARGDEVTFLSWGVDEAAWGQAVARVEAARARGKRWPVAANTLRLALGRPTNVPGRAEPATEEEPMPSPEEKAAIVRDFVADPAVADAVTVDIQAAGALARAGIRRAERQEAKTPKKAPWRVELAVSIDVRKARRALLDALTELREGRPLDDQQREDLVDDLADVQLAVDWLRSFLLHGDTSWDAALTDLVAKGEGR